MRTFARALRSLTRRVKHPAPEPRSGGPQNIAFATAAEQPTRKFESSDQAQTEVLAAPSSALLNGMHVCSEVCTLQQVCHACMRQNCMCNSPFTAVEASSWPSSPLFWGIPQMCTTSGLLVPELPQPSGPSIQDQESEGTAHPIMVVPALHTCHTMHDACLGPDSNVAPPCTNCRRCTFPCLSIHMFKHSEMGLDLGQFKA